MSEPTNAELAYRLTEMTPYLYTHGMHAYIKAVSDAASRLRQMDELQALADQRLKAIDRLRAEYGGHDRYSALTKAEGEK